MSLISSPNFFPPPPTSAHPILTLPGPPFVPPCFLLTRLPPTSLFLVPFYPWHAPLFCWFTSVTWTRLHLLTLVWRCRHFVVAISSIVLTFLSPQCSWRSW